MLCFSPRSTRRRSFVSELYASRLPAKRRNVLLLLLLIGVPLAGCTTTPPLPDQPPKLNPPLVAMQPARPLPTLGDSFAGICEASTENCLRRVLSVAAHRAQLYHDLAAKHSDLVEFIERANRDDDSGEQ